MRAASVSLKTQLRAWMTRGFASRLVSGFVLVALLTVFGKGVSFVKDAALARWFGTSDTMDAFVLAFGFLGFLASVLGGETVRHLGPIIPHGHWPQVHAQAESHRTTARSRSAGSSGA